MKSVLLYVNRDSGQEARMQAAMDVARKFDGHLTCLQVTPLESFAAVEPYGVSYMLTETITQLRELQDEERRNVEIDLANEGVNWDWLRHPGAPTRVIADHSWLRDLIVMSPPPEDWQSRNDMIPSPADVVVRSRAPVLVVPDESRGFDCAGPVTVAWNGSAESCAAIRAALPLLGKASAVTLVSVKEDNDHDLPSTLASTYLARHGIKSGLQELEPGSAPISDMLLQQAENSGAQCIVMGAYGHSRLRENLFGGVTRGMLLKSSTPLFLAH